MMTERGLASYYELGGAGRNWKRRAEGGWRVGSRGGVFSVKDLGENASRRSPVQGGCPTAVPQLNSSDPGKQHWGLSSHRGVGNLCEERPDGRNRRQVLVGS